MRKYLFIIITLVFATKSFSHTSHYKGLKKIEMDVTENLDIWNFKIICKRLACALGYNSKSVEEAFGSNIENEKQFGKTVKKLLKD